MTEMATRKRHNVTFMYLACLIRLVFRLTPLSVIPLLLHTCTIGAV